MQHHRQYCVDDVCEEDLVAYANDHMRAAMDQAWALRGMKEESCPSQQPLHTCLPSNAKDGDTFLSPIYLEWIDSASFSSWQDLDKVHELEPYYCRSFALLVRETDEALVITNTETYGLGSGFVKMFNGALSIPRRAVTREIRFSLAEARDHAN